MRIHQEMGRQLREAVVTLGVMVLAALGSQRALAALPEPSNIPPFIRTPEPGIFDTLPGPPTSPRAFADREILVPTLPPAPPTVLELEGTLADVQPSEVLVSRPGQPDASITLEPDSRLYVDGEPGAVRSLAPGMAVRVEYELDGNERVARRVRASTPGNPPPRR